MGMPQWGWAQIGTHFGTQKTLSNFGPQFGPPFGPRAENVVQIWAPGSTLDPKAKFGVGLGPWVPIGPWWVPIGPAWPLGPSQPRAWGAYRCQLG